VRILSQSALEVLQEYSWPGNVRELENLMERISILGTAEVISAEAIRSALELGQTDARKEGDSPETEETLSLAQMERKLIEKTLMKYEGHRQKTAQALGIGIRTLGMKLKRWQTEQASSA